MFMAWGATRAEVRPAAGVPDGTWRWGWRGRGGGVEVEGERWGVEERVEGGGGEVEGG